MKDFADRVVCITGAAAGIGKAVAIRFAQEGSQLALVDWNKERLISAEKEIQTLGVKVKAYKVDVSNRSMMFALADNVMDEFGAIDIVMNNAGIASKFAHVADTALETFNRLMDVHVWGTIYGTMAFLPHLLARTSETSIVNVSSLCGLTAAPDLIAYNTVKFAIRGFTESLWADLTNTRVNALLIHPGLIATDIVKHSPLIPGHEIEDNHQILLDMGKRMPVDEAAMKILAAIAGREKRLLLGEDAEEAFKVAITNPNSYNCA